nr:hypothetical protein [Tanacetum cinerariifolium]
MPSEYQQDYKKTRSYAPKLYNDPNMSDSLRDIYRALESRYVHEGRTIEPSFYNDLSNDSMAKFTAIDFNCLLSLDEKICPRALKDDPNMSKEQRETRGMFKNLGRALHNFAKILKKAMTSSFKTNSPNFKRKITRMSVKYPNYVNLTSSSEEQPNERTPSPPPRKKSLSPPQALSKSISSKSTDYTSSSSPMSPNDPYVKTMDNWPSGHSNSSPPLHVSRPPPDFPNSPPEFKPLPSTQPLFVNINNNTPLLHNNSSPLENIHHPPPNLGNQDFPNPPNFFYFGNQHVLSML